MAARDLPNLGLRAFYNPGDNGWGQSMSTNMLKLSVLTQGVASGLLADLPGSPAAGTVVVLNAAHPTHANQIAVYDNAAWIYITAYEGWLLYNQADNNYITFDGDSWEVLATGSGGGATYPSLDGNARKVLAVNVGEDGVEWVAGGSGGGGGGSAMVATADRDMWRVRVSDTESRTYVSLAEIEMRGAIGGADLCNGGTPMGSLFVGLAPANAFDNNPAGNSRWAGEVQTPWTEKWVGYRFLNSVTVKEVMLQAPDGGPAAEAPKTFAIEFYAIELAMWVPAVIVDGSANWGSNEARLFEIPDFVTAQGGGSGKSYISSTKWRLRLGAKTSDGDNTGIGRLAFYDGSDQLIAVAGSTASSSLAGNGPASAFDGVANTSWYTATGKHVLEWLQATFAEAHKVRRIEVQSATGSGIYTARDFTLEAFNGEAWVDCGSFVAAAWADNTPQSFVAQPVAGTGGSGGTSNNFRPVAIIQHAVANADVGSATANLATAPTAGNFIVLVSTGWQAVKSWSPAGFATVCAQYVANNSTQIAIKKADGTEGTEFKSFGQDRNNLTVYEIEAPDAIGIGGGPLSVQGNTWIIPSFQLNGQPSTTFVGIETDNFSALSYTNGPDAIISDYIAGGNHSGLHFVVEQMDFTEFKGQMASVNNPIAGYLQVAKRI